MCVCLYKNKSGSITYLYVCVIYITFGKIFAYDKKCPKNASLLIAYLAL